MGNTLRLSRAKPPYSIPSYSLTGDLLAYLKCGLQYRYQNKGALPPSTPVQLWFGEFIHAFMEEAFHRWSTKQTLQVFPWDYDAMVRPIELEVYQRLAARGLRAPFQLFCPADGSATAHCTCRDYSRQRHKLLASQRAEAAVGTWGAHLFPLISQAEVNIRGIRPMPAVSSPRADYYEVSGVIDVLSSVQLAQAPRGNLLLHHLSQSPAAQASIAQVMGDEYEVIVDYKGMRRPPTTAADWAHYAWQVRTYAWLRSRQPEAAPVVAGILLFVNELAPAKGDIEDLQKDVRNGRTDVMPGPRDRTLLDGWSGGALPALSMQFLEQRSVRVITVDQAVVDQSLDEFDAVVKDIERAVAQETTSGSVLSAWQQRPSGVPYSTPERRTCTACDHKYYCPLAATLSEFNKPPAAP